MGSERGIRGVLFGANGLLYCGDSQNKSDDEENVVLDFIRNIDAWVDSTASGEIPTDAADLDIVDTWYHLLLMGRYRMNR